MSKLSLVTLIACTVSIPSAMAFGGFGPGLESHGKVTFTGQVFANSCKIVSGDKDKHVKLNPVLNTLIKKTNTVQVQGFSIQVTDCFIHEKAVPKLAWGKGNILTDDGYLKNTSLNGAINVALLLSDSKGNKINLHDNDLRFEPEKNYIKGDISILTYKFNVGYIMPSKTFILDRATAGSVSAQANYSITYL
ncbi:MULTISPECIES: fimbrial protein [Citrobacter]|uniref:fimbrial protein n=1 Tax=Citrobacter TaxID=544 RepID=UPI000E3C3040|nr:MULTISPECIES: fimbrial protein [Citrobacter]MBD0828207.1 fimbrial protein [Citrobacter sp. C1]RFU91889.1 type 1 fimbrial protein [Citrobacter gillenii]